MAAAATAPKAKAAPRRRSTRRAPASRAAGAAAGRGHLIPLAVGRTAVAVSHIPDTRAIVSLTRGRAWIAVLGMLLIGIVGLNVATLGLNATATDVDRQIQTLEQENSILRARLEKRLSSQRVQQAAASLGLSTPSATDIHHVEIHPGTVEEAARRLAASG
jgi:hypothetical protein